MGSIPLEVKESKIPYLDANISHVLLTAYAVLVLIGQCFNLDK
jgi:hypothetical protein